MVDGTLNFDTKINTSGFEIGLKNLTGRIDKLKSDLLKISAVIGSVFSFSELVESAAEVNAANSQFEQTFLEFQGVAESAIERVAESSGIIKTRLNGVASSIYAFAKASGMDSVTALDMMEEALTVAADSAAYYDRSLEETSETLKSFLKGNFENDAALGLSCTETTRNAAANQLFGKSFIELSEAQKQLTLLEMVKNANKLSGAMGQAARESEGWENVLGNLKEQWWQFLAVIGQPALNIAISAVQHMTSVLEILTEKTRTAFSAISELFGVGNAETAEISANIAESTGNQESLTEAVEETEEAQKNSLAAFDKINTIASEATSETDITTPENSGKTVINTEINTTPVEKLSDLLAEKFRNFFIPIKTAWEDNSPEFIVNAEHAANAVKSLFSGIIESIYKIWTDGTGEEFTGNIIRLFGDILGIVGDIATAFGNAWEDNGRGDALIQSYFDRWNALLYLIHVISEDFREVWNDGTGEEICGNIYEIFTNINNTIANIRTNFSEAWQKNETGKCIAEDIFNIFDKISQTAENITFSVSEWAESTDFSPFLESIDELLKSLEPLSENVGKGLENFFNDVLLPLASWTTEDLIPTFLNAVSDAIEGINAAWKTAEPVVKERLWEKFLKPIAKFSADTATTAIELLGGAMKKPANQSLRTRSEFCWILPAE